MKPRLSAGLYVHVGKDKRRYYRIDFVHAGHRYRWRLGAVMPEQAEEKLRMARDWAQRKAMGLEPPPEKADAGVVIFDEVIERYLKDMAGRECRPKSIEVARRWSDHLKRYFGGRPIASITADDVEAVRDDLKITRRRRPRIVDGEKVHPFIRPDTQRSIMNALGTLLEFAKRRGWIRTNPSMVVGRPPREDRDDVFILPAEEDQRVIDEIGPQWRAGVLLALDHTMRIGSILALRLDDIRVGDRLLRIRGETVKRKRGTKRRKTVWKILTRRAAFYLHERIEQSKALDSPWLFPHPKDPSRAATHMCLFWPYQRVLIRLGFGPHHFHDLRHTSITRYKLARIYSVFREAEQEAMETAGHDSIRSHHVYDHIEDDVEHLRPIIDRLERWLEKRGAVIDPAATLPTLRRAA